MRSVKITALVLVLLTVLGLAGCSGKPKIDEIEALTQVVTEAQLQEFRTYPNLKYLDASGSTCYTALRKFMADCPQVEVVYTVPFGSKTVTNKETSLILGPEDANPAELGTNLRNLPALTALTLTDTDLTLEELDALKAAYPELTVSYTVSLSGQEYTSDAVSADLTELKPEELNAVLPKLALLPALAEVQLRSGTEEGALNPEQVKTLMDACPNVHFQYSFDLFGQTLSTDTETVEFVNAAIGDGGETAIRQALDILPRCTYFKLDECGLSNEVMASIREDYPNTKVVWRIHFGKYSALTDTEILKAVYNVFDHTVADLIYCNDVKYIDMGHNDTLTDVSFMAHMPKLEIVIISGSGVSDISCFQGNKNLVFLEMAYCYNLKDLSPLKECENLRFLNVGYTQVTNLEPLDNLVLERFVCIQNRVPYDEQELFKTFHPDCWTRFTGENPYSLGWRYEDIGETFSPFYLKMREIFGYE